MHISNESLFFYLNVFAWLNRELSFQHSIWV